MQSESSASAASPDTPRILLYNAATDSFERRGGERGNNSRQSTSTNPNGFIYGRQSEEQRSAVGCLGTVKSWYTPRYPNENLNVFYSSSDDKKKKIRGIPRYCNGRMKRWQFILLNLTLITLLLLAILVPLFYCVIIPKLIRDKIHSMDINSVNLTYIDLAGFKGQAFGFSALASMPPAMPGVPITAQVDPFTLTIKEPIHNKKLASISLDTGLSFKMSDDLLFDPNGTVSFSDADKAAILELVTQFSSLQGLPAQSFIGEAYVNFGVFGITFYRDFYIQKEIPLPALTSDMLDLIKHLPSYLLAEDLNSHIDSKYKPSDLVSIDSTFPSLKIQNLSVAMDDMGPVLDISITFENPLKLSLSATGIEAGIAVDGIPAARIAISDIKLFRGLQTLTANARVRFNDSTIDVTKLGPIISDTLSQMLFNPSPNTTISLVGPVRLKSAGFAEEISSTLSIRLPMKEMFAAFKLSEIQSLLSTSDGIKTVLSKSSFSANVTSQLITAPITMVLPRYLPLPDKIIIPAFASAGIYGGSQHTVTVGMSPIVVETTDDAIKISTIVTMLPNNTMAAANALADVVNPILESVPKSATVGLRDVVFKASALPESVYGWSKEVFGQVGLSITIPPFFSISQVIDVVTSNGTSLPMAIDHMNLNQLTDISGFAAAGSVRPIYPTNMTVPEIQMDLGYVEMGVLVQSTRVATAEMPQGLHMAASDPSVALNARAVVLRDDGIAPAVQNLINSMVGGPDAAPSSSIGVTGLMFGASKEEAFVTFSKIIISLDTAALMPLLSKTMMAVQEKLVAPGLIGFGGANMAVESSTLVTADAQVTFKNPLPISASLGGVRMEVSLDGKSAIQASTGELLLASGSSSLDLPAHLGLSDGSNGIAASVAALVNDLIALRAPSTSVSISGLVIKAPGSVSSVTDAATIDQFKNIVLRLPASILDKINPLRPNSPIDVSAMLPSMDNIIEKVNPVFHSFSLDTLPNAKISSSISVGYTNPVPLSVKLPYARLVVQVDSTSIAIVHVSGLSLAIQNGQMVPQIMVAFGNDNDRVAEIVASLVDSAISELTSPFSTSLVKRDQQRKFGLNGIYFGMSEADSNGILSAVDVDVSFLAEKISMDQVKRLLTRYIPINFPASIEDLSKYFSPSITELDVAMLPAHSMDLKAGATLSLPFAINSLIGFLESDFGINQSPMASVSLASGLHITSRSSGGEGSVPATLDAGARIQFTDDISCAVSVARLIENTLQGSPYDTTLVVRNIVVGYSPTDFIKAFSRISISVSFDSLLKPIRPLIDAIIENVKENLLKSIHEMEKSDAGIKQIASSVSIPIYGGIAITPKSASVSMKPGSKIDLGLELGISMPFPVSANIPYMSLVGSLDTLSAVVVEANGFSVKPNSVNDVSLSTTLSIQDSDALSEKLQSIVADFMITGRISSLFGVNSVYFGSSSSDKISILDKFGISMDVNPYLPPVVDFMSKRGQSLINSLISTMETITMEDIQSGNPLHLGYGILISMRKAHLEMQQHQSVYIGIDMGIVFPFKLSVDIPYIGMDVGIDSVQAMGVQVNGFKVGDSVTTSVINGSSLLSVGTLLSIKDTTDLADKLASVADNLMAGNNFTTSSSQIVFGGAAFGASQADHVKALNRVVIQFGLNSRFIVSLSNTMKRLSSSVDPIKLVSALGINITDMAASLQPGQIIDMSASASFKLPFPIIFKVGYMSAFGGLDGIDVSRLDLDGGLSVGSQTVNGLVLKGSIFMPSAEMVRKKVAAFVDHVMVKGISNLDEIATFSQLKFGFSSQDYIKALSKIQIGAKISQIITQSLIDKIVLEYFGFPSSNDISLDFVVSLLYKFVKDRGVVNSAILDASKFGSIIAGVDAGVTKMELIAKVDVGYAAMTPLFNKLVLAQVAIDRISLYSNQGSVFANISSQIALTNDNFQLQAHVAELVSQLMNPNNSTPVTASVGVSGLVFGYSDADVIDTFADVSLNFSPGAAVRRLKDEFSKTVYDYFNGKDVNLGFGDIEWQITKSIVSLAEENVVLTDAAIALPGLNRFYFNIPFINFQASLYNGNVASVKVANMMLVNGVLTSMTYITFVNDNPALMQRILTMSTNLIFWRWKLEPERQDRPVAAGGGGMMFGSSESHAYTLASTAAIDLDVTFVIDRLGDAMANPDDPLVKLADIDAELNYKGLDTRIYMNNLPTWLPLDLKIGGLHGRLTHTTAEDYNTPVYELADAYFYDFVLEPGKAISCGLLIIPAVEQLQKPLEIAVPLLLSWNSYSHYAKLGYASLTEFDTRPFWVREDPSAPQDPVPTGKRLSILTDAFFDAPDLYLWQPVQLTNISWINPFSEHLVKISAVFPNPGPLNVDAGRLTWDIMGSFNTKLVELATTNNIVVQSRLHGGNDIRSNPKNLEVLVSYNFWGGLASFNPMFVYNLWRSLIDGDQAALERLNHITIYRDGGARPGPIAWLNRVAEMVLKPSVENMAQITCSLYHKAQEWKSLTYDTDGSVTGNFTYDPLPRKHYSRGDAFDCAWKFVFGESQEISDVDVRMPGAWPTGSSSSDQASSSSSTMATGTITSSASTMAATVVSTTSEIRLPGAWPSSAFSSSNHNNNHKTLVRRRRVNIK